MSTKNLMNKNEPTCDPNSPISQSSHGLHYVPMNEAGREAFRKLTIWASHQTGKKMTYNATILYLKELIEEGTIRADISK